MEGLAVKSCREAGICPLESHLSECDTCRLGQDPTNDHYEYIGAKRLSVKGDRRGG